MKNFQKKKKTDIFDAVEFYNRIIIGTEDEPATINCPYPDKLTREANSHFDCEECEYLEGCVFFKNEATPEIFYYEFIMSNSFPFRDESKMKDN